MQKGRPFKWLPSSPHFSKFSNKIALGVFIATFLLNFQPQMGFPPLTQSKAHAQEEQATASTQTQLVNASSLPVQFQLPHPGYLSTPYSTYHPGIDIASGLGMPIKPVAKGIVIQAGFNFWGLGLTVEVDHGHGYKSLYAHLGKTYTSVGKEVEETDIIGEVGLTGHTTGPHTHLEVFKDNSRVNPIALLPTLRNYPTQADLTPITGGQTNNPFPQKPTIVAPVYAPAPTPTPTSAPKKVEEQKPSLNLTVVPQTLISKPTCTISLSLTKPCN